MPWAPWLSIVIPTVGRKEIQFTLESILHQPESIGVEILVVADTHSGVTPEIAAVHASLGDDQRIRWLEHDGGEHCYGQPQRNYGQRLALAPYVAFSQDDNILTEGALEAIHAAVGAQQMRMPLIFRFVAPWRETIWRWPQLLLGNLDADCLVIPRQIVPQVEWGMRYEGDFDAAYAAYQAAGDNAEWIDRVVTIARPSYAHYWWL